jgi:hypothetical protein
MMKGVKVLQKIHTVSPVSIFDGPSPTLPFSVVKKARLEHAELTLCMYYGRAARVS